MKTHPEKDGGLQNLIHNNLDTLYRVNRLKQLIKKIINSMLILYNEIIGYNSI
jgi:hypothetical protein